jgi:hypothetical protein
MRKVKKNPPTFPWHELASLSWHELVPLKDLFARIMPSMGAPDLAALRLYEDQRNERLRSVVVYISSDKKHTVTYLNPSDWEKWRQVRALAGDVMEPPVNGYCFAPRVDVDKQYPIAATPTMTAARQSNDIRPPERRRGPVTTHDWHSIDGEIARRCIDPKTGRVEVPKKENALVAEMRKWCEEQGWAVPATSEMSEAVRRICAALRKAQK